MAFSRARETRKDLLDIPLPTISCMVVAIDFGTTYTGCAYSFKSDYDENPLKVFTQNFVVGGGQHAKVPTSILFTPGADFHSFGTEAEEKYARMSDEEPREARKWFYFERFKMSLFKNETLSRTTMLLDHTQKKGMPAAKVFSASIGYLRRHVMKILEERTRMGDADITWVLTVPAIWDDPSRQFMREAAQQAGIPGEQLVLALEPEAASVYCLEHYRSSQTLSQPFRLASPGKKFMLVDCGEDTVNISVFELRGRSSLRQLHRPVGAPAGGTKVDDAFKRLILDIVGFDGVASFGAMEMLQLRRVFETTKRQHQPSSKVFITLPTSMKVQMEVKVQERNKYSGKVSTVRNKLMLDRALFQSLFAESVRGIIDAMQTVFQSGNVGKLDAILLTGGLSKFDVIQEAVKEAFPRDLVLVAPSPSAAVLTGAVMYGHNPDVIATRVSTYTYGVAMESHFREGSPGRVTTGTDEDQKEIHIHIQKEQEVKLNSPLSDCKVWPVRDGQVGMTFHLYRSTKKEPHNVDEKECEKVGSLRVLTPDVPGASKRLVKSAMVFGRADVEFHARYEIIQAFSTTCDFLS